MSSNSFVVDGWLDQQQSVLNNKALNSLVELTLEDRKNTSIEHKDILEQSSKQLKLQKKDQLGEFKDKVRRLWENYKSPRRTIADAHSEFYVYRTGVKKDYENKEAFNVSAAMRENKYVPSLPPPTFPECEPVVQAGDRFFPCCPRTGQVLAEVLENPFKVTLEDFGHLVVITPHSNSLHILESVQQMLIYGELIGLTRSTMSNIFKEMIRTYLPSHFGIFNLLSDPNEVFNSVVSLVNYDSLMANIKKAIMQIERKIGDSIEGPLNTYKSLLLEASGLENPLLERHKAISRAEKQCINVAGYLVESELKNCLDLLRARFDYRMEKRPSLENIVAFITDLERMDQYRLKSPKRLLGNNINCSLFTNDVFVIDGASASYPDADQHLDHEVDLHTQSYGGFQNKSQVDAYKRGGYGLRKPSMVKQIVPSLPALRRDHQTPGGHQHSHQHSQPQRHSPSGSAHRSRYDQHHGPSSSDSRSRNQDQGNSRHSGRSQSPHRSRNASGALTPESRSGSPRFIFDRHGQVQRIQKHRFVRRTASGNYRRASWGRRSNSRGSQDRNRNMDRNMDQKRKGCPSCGLTSHSRPQSLDRLSHVPRSDICKYVNLPVMPSQCYKCRKGLKHPSNACREAPSPGPGQYRPPSAGNQPSHGNLNSNLN